MHQPLRLQLLLAKLLPRKPHLPLLRHHLRSLEGPAGSSSGSTAAGSLEDQIRLKAERLRGLVDQTVSGHLTEKQLEEQCRTLNVSLVEFHDILGKSDSAFERPDGGGDEENIVDAWMLKAVTSELKLKRSYDMTRTK